MFVLGLERRVFVLLVVSVLVLYIFIFSIRSLFQGFIVRVSVVFVLGFVYRKFKFFVIKIFFLSVGNQQLLGEVLLSFGQRRWVVNLCVCQRFFLWFRYISWFFIVFVYYEYGQLSRIRRLGVCCFIQEFIFSIILEILCRFLVLVFIGMF